MVERCQSRYSYATVVRNSAKSAPVARFARIRPASENLSWPGPACPTRSGRACTNSAMFCCTIVAVTGRPSCRCAPWRSHCHTCAREISAVAASSIRSLIGTQPMPPSHPARDCSATLRFVRRPSAVISPAGRAIGEHAFGAAAQLLDVAEDVVPAPAVEPGGVVAQLPQDLVRLERREDRLDQDGRADRAARHPERVLRKDEDVVPEARLEMALELREIEVGSRAARDHRRGGVEEGESEIE